MFGKRKKINNILFIRSGAIGDVVQTTNTYRAIKKAYPSSKIDYVTSESILPLLKNDSDLNNVFTLKTRNYFELTDLGLKLLKNHYDLVVNLQPSPRFRYLAFLTRAKLVLNFKKNTKVHAVDNYFSVLKSVFPELESDDELHLYIDENKVKEFAKLYNPDNKKLVIINTQATSARAGRKWNLDRFLELSLELIKKYDCRILVSGSKQDLLKVAYFHGVHNNITVIAGEHSLEDSAAIFSGADLFISGDTGPLHIASAFDKPVCIGIFGSTPVIRCAPKGKKHFTIHSQRSCVPCFKKKCRYSKNEITPCMEDIRVDQVLDIIEKNKLL